MAAESQEQPLLRRDQRRVIAALMSCRSVREAHKRTGIHRNTIAKWFRSDRWFQRAMDRASDAVFAATMHQAKLAAGEALAAFRKLLKSQDEKTVLEAAKAVFENSFDADLVVKAYHASRSAEGVPSADRPVQIDNPNPDV